MKNFKQFHLIVLVFIFLLSACSGGSSTGSEETAYYYIENKGSDTMVNLALKWAEEYQALHPEIRISVTGGGSGTGISALLSNTVDIANASRKIKDAERETAESNQVHPVEFIVAQDAIAVIVHPDNPVSQLTLAQLSDIFTGKITNWQMLGGEDRPIVKVSRETNSGTHVYFLESVIRMGDGDDKRIFSADTLLLPSSEGIIAEVSSNPNAIGYDGLGYITHDVKMIGVAVTVGEGYILPSKETTQNGTYPISRDLYIYTNGEPEGFILDYINWIFSDAGQAIVSELGFVPVR